MKQTLLFLLVLTIDGFTIAASQLALTSNFFIQPPLSASLVSPRQQHPSYLPLAASYLAPTSRILVSPPQPHASQPTLAASQLAPTSRMLVSPHRPRPCQPPLATCQLAHTSADAATSFCLEVTAAEETNELYHLFHLQDHQLFQDLDSRSSWACALLAIFLLSNQTVFHLILSTETRHEIHKVFYNCLSIYVWGDTH